MRETLRGRIHIWDYPKGNQAIRTPSRVQWLTRDRQKRRSYPRVRGNGTASVTPASSTPPITCYPTHGKRLAQCGDCRILRKCSVSPSPQLCRCPPERRRAPTHEMRQHSEWSELSPQGAQLALRLVRQVRRPPLSSGPTSVWRQPSLPADLGGRQRAAQSF